jgi:PTS system galactitol-specific IIA component
LLLLINAPGQDSGVIDPTLCVARLVADSSDAVLRELVRRLFTAGHVRPSFENAVLARERRSPTGLPFPGVAVALPHAEPEHVVSPAIAVASLLKPVSFRQMGSPAVKLDVALVVMPALTAKEQAAAALARWIQRLQDETLRRELALATDDAALCAALARAFAR